MVVDWARIYTKTWRELAPEVVFEPTPSRLTAGCSTIELLWNPNRQQFIICRFSVNSQLSSYSRRVGTLPLSCFGTEADKKLTDCRLHRQCVFDSISSIFKNAPGSGGRKLNIGLTGSAEAEKLRYCCI